jgi:hypothetical protein
LDLLANLDQCFLAGFANLNRSHWKTLNSLSQILTGTPLEQKFAAACDAIKRNEFLDEHFTAIAAIRASLQGALFDALGQQVRSGLGRGESLPTPEFVPNPFPAEVKPLLQGIRHWLMEIALMGYGRLEASNLVAFLTTLERIQTEPALVRQAALLTGFWQELMTGIPVSGNRALPLQRWVDLWGRSLLSTWHFSIPKNPQTVSGTFELLGLDLRQHANLVSLTGYGLLTPETMEQPQLAKLNLSAYKVDAINADELWLLFPHAVPLFEAWSQTKVLELKDMPRLPTGDLLWNGNGEVGGKYNLIKRASQFAVNAKTTALPCLLHPCDRHPIQLAEPIFLENYQVKDQDDRLRLSWPDGEELPIAMERLSTLSEVNGEAIGSSTQLFGLLRFDAGQWSVQPLTVAIKKKLVFTGQKAAKICKSPPKTSTVNILQERASRLLRKQRSQAKS